jgi:hypothetical protein
MRFVCFAVLRLFIAIFTPGVVPGMPLLIRG